MNNREMYSIFIEKEKELEKEIKQLKKDLNFRDGDIKSLKIDVEKLINQLKDKDKEILNLSKEYDELLKEINILKLQNKTLINGVLDKEVNELIEQKYYLENKVVELDKENKKLNKEILRNQRWC